MRRLCFLLLLGVYLMFLKALRHQRLANPAIPPPAVIYTSTTAVYGRPLPDVVTDTTPHTPESSYGTAKAMMELLLSDMHRRNFISALTVRLPTISVRAGAPTGAASSFCSGIIREPLKGEESVCPIGSSLDDPELERVEVWLSSPKAVVTNISLALYKIAAVEGQDRTINLPGVTLSVRGMLAALEKEGGTEALRLVRFEEDQAVKRLVATWPARFDVTKATAIGFVSDADRGGFETAVREFKQQLDGSR
jgi:nucleoside-diphosphate-sugar epimerase